MSEVNKKAVSMLEEELGHPIDYETGFGQWVQAKDRAFQKVGIFIEASEKDPELKKFWKEVENELLNNV